MKRFLYFAVLLAIANAAAQVIVIGAFRHLDLRFSTFLEFLMIPLAQAAALVWLAPSNQRWTVAAREFAANRLLLAAFVLDIALLVFVSRANLPIVWTAHGVFAAALVLLVARRAAPNDAAWLYAFAAGLALFALSYTTSWLSALPFVFGKRHTVVRWFVAYAPLYVIAIVVLLRIGSILDRASSAAGRLVDISIACSLGAAVIVVSNIFFHPFLVEPWRSIERPLAWLVMTTLILAATAVLTRAGASHETA